MDHTSDQPSVGSRSTRRGFSSRSLAKAIFEAPSPEAFTRTLPAQSLYLVLRQQGLASSGDLIMLSSIEQMRLLLDFDCWNRDQFNEDHFWEWLSLGDDEDGLRLLQKLVQAIDLRILGLLISRHVDVQVFDEPTDNPPAAGYYTPDKGSTWLQVRIEDNSKHFLFSRLLAMIFETSAELFYQLLATPSVATDAMLEEESYIERNKRLAAEGIPEPEFSAQLHQTLPQSEFKSLLERTEISSKTLDISVIEPLVYDSLTPSPLSHLIAEARIRDSLESEITLLMNAAMVHYGIEFGNHQAVVQLAERVKGAINIGLEAAMELTKTSALDIYDRVGIRDCYRHATSLLNNLRAHARKLSTPHMEQTLTLAEQEVLSTLKAPFPFIPRFYAHALKSHAQTGAFTLEPPGVHSLDTAPEAIMTLATVRQVELWYSELGSPASR